MILIRVEYVWLRVFQVLMQLAKLIALERSEPVTVVLMLILGDLTDLRHGRLLFSMARWYVFTKT